MLPYVERVEVAYAGESPTSALDVDVERVADRILEVGEDRNVRRYVAAAREEALADGGLARMISADDPALPPRAGGGYGA